MVAVGDGAGGILAAGTPLVSVVRESLRDNLKIDVALIRATAGGFGWIKDVVEHADEGMPGAEVLG